MLLLKGHAAAGKAGLFLHHVLAGLVAAPHRFDIAAFAGGNVHHLVHGCGREGARGAIFLRAGIQGLAHSLQLLGNDGFQFFQRGEQLFAVCAAHQHTLAFFNVFGPYFQAQGHALHLPLGKFPAGGIVRRIQLHAAELGKARAQLFGLFHHAGLVRGHRHNHHLVRRHGRGQNQPLVVPVRHDDGAHQAGGNAPRRLEGELQLVVAPGELHAKRAREPVAEIVAGAALQGLAVVHHGLDGVGGLGACKFFAVCLFALQHGDVQLFLTERGIGVQLLLCLGNGLFGRLVDGVPLLPPELAAAQKRARGLFPAHHAAPLVILHGQVAPRVQHMRKVVAEQRLGRGAHAQAVFQFFRAAHCHPRHLGRKALYMVFFLLQQALWNKQRHGHVFMAGFFEALVQQVHDVFPNGIAVWAQNHAALHGRVVHQFCLQADVGIPLGEVLVDGGNGFHHFFVLAHTASPHRKFSKHAAARHRAGARIIKAPKVWGL